MNNLISVPRKGSVATCFWASASSVTYGVRPATLHSKCSVRAMSVDLRVLLRFLPLLCHDDSLLPGLISYYEIRSVPRTSRQTSNSHVAQAEVARQVSKIHII